MSSLSAEQKARMEENRRKAIEIRAAKLKLQGSSTSHQIQEKQFYKGPSGSPVNNTWTTKANQNMAKKTFLNAFSNNTVKNSYSKNSSEKVGNSSRQDGSKRQDSVKSGALTLLSKDRFELVMDYHQPTIDVIKALPGREYDSNKRNWNFPLTQYDIVVAALKKLQPSVLIGELPPLVKDTFLKRKYPHPTDVDISRIQPSMRSILMDFQVESVKYAVSRGGRVLIADDMGLGKTIQALAIADYYCKEWPLLIVCPSSMRFHWFAEIQKYLVNVNPGTIFVITNGKDVLGEDSKVVITSYDLMTSFKSQLLSRKFGVVIMDESHHLKNPKALRTKAGSEILKQCSRCILLSGTPVLSRPVELHCQLQCIKPHIFNKFMDFGVRYCDAKKSRFGWDFSGSNNMQELNVVLKELLMIRRLKTEVLSQLPPKRREVVMLESTGKKLSETSNFAKILETEGLKGLAKQSTLLSYFQETGVAKIKGIVQYVQDMIENGEKFLIFAHHSKILDAICGAAESSKADYIRIDGSVPSDVRKELCTYFQEQDSCQVAVLSIKAANTGLTLTAAHLVIFAELYWNPGDLIQAEDRAHRIGQADSVLVQYLIQRGTADDKMWPLIQEKLNLLHKAGLGQDEFNIEASVQVKSKVPIKEEEDAADLFSPEDDAALAELNLNDLENSFEIPEKRARVE